uniref:Uncharacterized protein n=1 Tax=Felis catus TaxID=9685 RepID=A0ABI7YLM0_FELCA
EVILRIRNEGVETVKQEREKVSIRVFCQCHYWEHWDLNFTGIVIHLQNTSQNFPAKGQESGALIHWLLFSTLQGRSGESGHPCLILHLRGKTFTLSPVSTMLAVDLSYMSFIMLTDIPTKPTLLRVFIINGS